MKIQSVTYDSVQGYAEVALVEKKEFKTSFATLRFPFLAISSETQAESDFRIKEDASAILIKALAILK